MMNPTWLLDHEGKSRVLGTRLELDQHDGLVLKLFLRLKHATGSSLVFYDAEWLDGPAYWFRSLRSRYEKAARRLQKRLQRDLRRQRELWELCQLCLADSEGDLA